MEKQETKRFAVLEKDYYKNGYHCIIVFTMNGVRNGYIGIPKSNKMYGLNYSEKTPLLPLKENQKFNGDYIGLFCLALGGDSSDKCLSPALYFSAHCGFTYSAPIEQNGEYHENKDLWYFGFDCNHAGDKQDWQKAYEYGLIDKKSLDFFTELDLNHNIPDEEHRSLEYVENCLNTLADEFLEFEEKE